MNERKNIFITDLDDNDRVSHKPTSKKPPSKSTTSSPPKAPTPQVISKSPSIRQPSFPNWSDDISENDSSPTSTPPRLRKYGLPSNIFNSPTSRIASGLSPTPSDPMPDVTPSIPKFSFEEDESVSDPSYGGPMLDYEEEVSVSVQPKFQEVLAKPMSKPFVAKHSTILYFETGLDLTRPTFQVFIVDYEGYVFKWDLELVMGTVINLKILKLIDSRRSLKFLLKDKFISQISFKHFRTCHFQIGDVRRNNLLFEVTNTQFVFIGDIISKISMKFSDNIVVNSIPNEHITDFLCVVSEKKNLKKSKTTPHEINILFKHRVSIWDGKMDTIDDIICIKFSENPNFFCVRNLDIVNYLRHIIAKGKDFEKIEAQLILTKDQKSINLKFLIKSRLIEYYVKHRSRSMLK